MKNIFLGCLLLFTTAFNTAAQFKKTQTPLKLAEGVISTDDVFMGAITPDNREVYFVKSGKTRTDLKILFSVFSGGKWSEPQPAPFATGANDIDPFVAPGGDRLIFNSNKSLTDGRGTSDYNIWAADREGNGWGKPYVIEALRTDSTEFFATTARNGNMYFASIRPEGAGGVDIYMSKFENGDYRKPVPLPANINTAHSDSNPYIAPDESYLIFLSSRPGGYGGSDLYVSFNKNGSWSEPQNLGPVINTDKSEFCPVMTADGKTFLFSRTHRTKTGEIVEENIYYVSTRYTLLNRTGN